MQSELKPCPFCGGEAELRAFQPPEFWVACQKVGCKANTEGFDSKERAIAAWNARASDAEITRLTEALRLQMEAKHKEAAEAKLWFQKAQEWKEALRAAVEREKGLREALFNATALIGHSVPMDTTALVAGEQLTAQGVWLQGRAALAGAKP